MYLRQLLKWPEVLLQQIHHKLFTGWQATHPYTACLHYEGKLPASCTETEVPGTSSGQNLGPATSATTTLCAVHHTQLL
jgi:hypothetical protein